MSACLSRGWCCSTILAAFNIKYVLSRRHRVPTFGLFYAAWPLSCGFLASQRCPIFLQIFWYDELESNWASIPAHLVSRMHSMGAIGHGQGIEGFYLCQARAIGLVDTGVDKVRTSGRPSTLKDGFICLPHGPNHTSWTGFRSIYGAISLSFECGFETRCC